MFWIVLWLVMAAICAMIAAGKGRSALGFFFYGLLIWPIALVHILIAERTVDADVAALQRQGRHQCSFCSEWIMRSAIVCPHCRRDLPLRT